MNDTNSQDGARRQGWHDGTNGLPPATQAPGQSKETYNDYLNEVERARKEREGRTQSG